MFFITIECFFVLRGQLFIVTEGIQSWILALPPLPPTCGGGDPPVRTTVAVACFGAKAGVETPGAVIFSGSEARATEHVAVISSAAAATRLAVFSLGLCKP